MYTGKLFSSKQEFKISLHIYALKQVFSQGKMTVAKYKRFFYNLPIVGERTEQQLILLAKGGLKEEIMTVWKLRSSPHSRPCSRMRRKSRRG
ncbi:unnamed protein product [Brassica napus]|uniref:(rape) hypothetical protein n=1 Tax=Brassica napus TaxID=3708 RepID=A0A816MP97_BRANA|nr:unnamed protein product [Brassica napus]